MNRRKFLQTTGAITFCATAAPPFSLTAAENHTLSSRHLPRWRGFNLTEKCVKQREGNVPFQERDFALLAEWGFDFARLPLSYHFWSDPNDPLTLRGEDLKDIDDAVEFGRKHGVHVNLNLHRAPGYCVNPPREPLDLWTDEKAVEACAFHWAHLAKRYKGIRNERLSFDLLNEPANVSEAAYVRVVKHLIGAIRGEDPQRLIIADGLQWGRDPVIGLVGLGIAQSTRGYDPMQLTHYKANWVKGSNEWPEPSWPLRRGEKDLTTKETLRQQRIQPWKQLERKGVGIHVGEWGVFNQTPHKAALSWMRDCLDLWKEAGWGWALWNLHGSFGVLDSNRADVEYEDFRGRKLDMEMLRLLQSF
ncbi:MAG: endoglucanase [Verrucomicrobiota bacterium]